MKTLLPSVVVSPFTSCTAPAPTRQTHARQKHAKTGQRPAHRLTHRHELIAADEVQPDDLGYAARVTVGINLRGA